MKRTMATATALLVLMLSAAASPATPVPATTLSEDPIFEVTTATLLPDNDTIEEMSTVVADGFTGSVTVEAERAEQADGGVWRCPRACECATLPEGTSYNCSLPSGLLAFDEYGDGVTFKCQSGEFRCSEVPLATSAGRGALPDAGRGALRPALSSVTLSGCALPAEPLACALARRGARTATKLNLQTPRSPLEPVHLTGLEDLQMLRITDLEGAPTELPLRALGALPQLRQLTVNEARLQLRAPLPVLPLLALELAADALAELPPRAFRALPQLRRLGLWANALTDLPEDTFEGLDELRELSLSQNLLTSLPATLLRRTPRLERLDLYANRLRGLPAGLLAGLPRLLQVRLMDNRGNLTLAARAFAELPALRELDLSRSALLDVPGDALAGARELRVLRLARCRLRRLPPALLAGLASLDTLDLSGNLLAHLPQGLFSDLQNLNELNLDNNLLTALNSSSFLGLHNLDTLSLNGNRLAEIAADAFVGVRRLQRLSLSRNLLALGASERDGEYEPLGAPPSAFAALPSLRRLDLSHNRVAALLDDWRLVLVSLQRLDLAWNCVAELNYVNMNFLSSSVTVDLRHNNISTVLWGESGGSAVFLLDDNPFECDCHTPALRDALDSGGPGAPGGGPGASGGGPRLVAPAATCAAPPALRGRALPAVTDEELACALPAPLCPRACSCLLQPHLLRLDCGALPARLPDPNAHGVRHLDLRLRNASCDMRFLRGVRKLDLSALDLTEVPPLAAGVEVDLTGNRLSRVPAELLAANTLRLAGNPLACDCEHAADVLALQRAGGERVRDYGALRCADGAGLRGVPSDSLCVERDAVILAVVLVCVAAVVLCVCYQLRRLGGGVLCWVLGCGCCSPDDEDDLGKTYHAFLSFAHEDTALAEATVAALEAPPYSLRVCVHYRDWALGDWIPEQIASSVNDSRRTVIILSRAFLSSYWGLLEFREAHRRAIADGKARIIVVLAGDVLQDPRLDDELRAYLATTTYLHRDDARFLPKLAAALRPRRTLLQALLRRPAPAPAPAAAVPSPAAPSPAAPSPAAPAPAPAPAVDKLIGIALEGKLTQDGKLVNAAVTAPSL